MDIELQLAVENLLARYVHALDEDRLEDWPGFFVESGRYRITTAENHERGLPLSIIYADSRAMLRDRVSALRHANIYEAQRYRHTVVRHARRAAGRATRRARCRTSRCCASCTPGEAALFASGRYLDRIRLNGEGGRPQFEEKIVVCDSRRFDTLLAIPL